MDFWEIHIERLKSLLTFLTKSFAGVSMESLDMDEVCQSLSLAIEALETADRLEKS